jgi:large subunit ribosomal protein L4
MTTAKKTLNTKKAVMLSAPVYAASGKESGTIELPKELFAAKWNGDLVQQVVVGMQANARPIVADTKGRGEVRGGGRKPWKQKGTGRARHGSSRSPIWKGGGVTGGPTSEAVYRVKINDKMRAKAFAQVLSRKFKDGEVIFVEKFTLAAPKTKDARTILAAIAKAAKAEKIVTKEKNAVIIALANKDVNAEKSFRNMKNLLICEARNLNPVTLLGHSYLIIENPFEAIATLLKRVTK